MYLANIEDSAEMPQPRYATTIIEKPSKYIMYIPILNLSIYMGKSILHIVELSILQPFMSICRKQLNGYLCSSSRHVG